MKAATAWSIRGCSPGGCSTCVSLGLGTTLVRSSTPTCVPVQGAMSVSQRMAQGSLLLV